MSDPAKNWNPEMDLELTKLLSKLESLRLDTNDREIATEEPSVDGELSMEGEIDLDLELMSRQLNLHQASSTIKNIERETKVKCYELQGLKSYLQRSMSNTDEIIKARAKEPVHNSVEPETDEKRAVNLEMQKLVLSLHYKIEDIILITGCMGRQIVEMQFMIWDIDITIREIAGLKYTGEKIPYRLVGAVTCVCTVVAELEQPLDVEPAVVGELRKIRMNIQNIMKIIFKPGGARITKPDSTSAAALTVVELAVLGKLRTLQAKLQRIVERLSTVIRSMIEVSLKMKDLESLAQITSCTIQRLIQARNAELDEQGAAAVVSSEPPINDEFVFNEDNL